MVSLKKNNKGFTIVELLIVIVVIGILALLVITAYGGITAKARNATRQTSLNSLQTHLEAFFTANAYYPSLTDMTTGASATSNATATWVTTNMKGLDETALVDPSNANQSKLLVAGTDFTTGVAKSFVYHVTAADGTTSCETDHTTCAKYALIATYEGTVSGQTTFIKNSLN